VLGVLTKRELTDHDAVSGVSGSQHMDKRAATDENVSKKALQ
jgi:hypothetical protein